MQYMRKSSESVISLRSTSFELVAKGEEPLRGLAFCDFFVLSPPGAVVVAGGIPASALVYWW